MLKINNIRGVIHSLYVMPGATNSQIARLNGCSRQSVRRLISKLASCHLEHPAAVQSTNTDITRLLYPSLQKKLGTKREPDYTEIYKESLKKHGKTITVQYLEYQAINPDTAYCKTQYFYLVRKFLKKSHLAMRQQHVAGDVIFIDYAGTQVCYVKSGKKIWLKVFVACLGSSKKVFAFATVGERTIDWIGGMTGMFDDIGGVTEVISIDNASALVARAGLLPTLVKNIVLFGVHYGCIIDSCRVAMPQDKALAELSVKFVKQRILIPMNTNMTFHSIDEVNEHLVNEVEKLNNLPFQKINTTRNKLFNEIEKSALKPLPATRFEAICDFKKLKVPPTYHLLIDQHEYSVPYTLAQEVVEVIVTQSHAKVEFDNKLVAEHQRSDDIGGCTTLTEHMPKQHQAEALKTQDEYLDWAENIGENAALYVQVQYSKTTNPKSRAIGKQCQALMKLCTKNGSAVFNKACDYALRNKINPSEMALVISAIDDLEPTEIPTPLLTHRNIRGKGCFGGHYEH